MGSNLLLSGRVDDEDNLGRVAKVDGFPEREKRTPHFFSWSLIESYLGRKTVEHGRAAPKSPILQNSEENTKI